MNSIKSILVALAVVSAGVYAAPAHAQGNAAPMMDKAMAHKTGAFKGPEANGGFATLTGRTLKLSPDFKIPKSPAPTWRVIDSEGNEYLLKQLTIAGGKTNRSVMLPKYIKNVAKVQIYCTFAEVVLGEASFAEAIDLP